MVVPETPRILLVDDEPDMLKLIPVRLRAEHFEVEVARSGPEALDRLSRESFALLITDLMMPGMSGLELLDRVRKSWPEMAVIILTAHGTIEGAVDAVKKGATDFLTKPVRSGELLLRVNNALHQWELEREVRELRGQIQRSRQASDLIVGQSQAVRRVLQQISRLASRDVAVVIYGESGTGKELVARAIHRESGRKDGPFVAVKCGALSEELLRDELFGHEKGAFTGAHAQKKGLFEEAEGGVLFLDEIGEISSAIQVQLLRVLQSQEFTRLGGTQTIQANVRIISATNRDLQRAVKEGRFREDLFYRLDVVPIRIPPLRERREDIPLLVAHFVQRFQQELGRIEARGFTPEAIRELCNRDWPGNIRELENKVKRLMVMSNREWIGVDSVVTDLADSALSDAPQTLTYDRYKQRVLENTDRAYFEAVLRRHRGNVSESARSAGLDRKSFWRKMKRYGLDAVSFRNGG
jgi:two-component system response regulator HydG